MLPKQTTNVIIDHLTLTLSWIG